VAVTDVDGDGREDLVYRVTGSDGLDQINMVRIDDDGEDMDITVLHRRLDKSIVVVGMGDLDGDGIPDLVLRDPKNYTLTYLLLNRDSGGEYWGNPLGYPKANANGGSEWTTAWAYGKYMTPLAVGNLQGDARAEVLFRDSRSPSYARIDVYDPVIQSMGSQFLIGRLKSLPGTLIGAADVNGDGKLDLVFNSSGKISYAYTETATVGSTYTSDYQMGTPVTVLSATQTSGMGFSLLADFDNDDKADMVWRNKTTGELGYTLSSRSATLPLALTRGTDVGAVTLARARPTP
jgi:hypothetical protein